MAASHQKYLETRFFGSLDGLRALSILGVIWTHTWYGTPQYNWLKDTPILRSGPVGVDVFFTISGFLITTLLIRERTKYGDISLKDFYIRRALRIWPIYYGVLALYVVLVLFTEHGTARGHAFFHYLPTYLTYTYTWFGPAGTEPGAIFNFAWSLSTEEQFYFFWPLVVKVLRRPWAVLIMAAVVALRVATGYGLLSGVLPDASLAHRIIMSIAVPICMGALLAQALASPRAFRALYAVLGHKASAPIALILVIAAIAPATAGWPPGLWIALPALIGACVIREDNGLAGILRFKPVAFIGVVSYGMYLYNTLVVKALRPAASHAGMHHPLMVLPLTLAVSVLIAWLSFRYFESPFLALKNKFSRLRPPPNTLAPVAPIEAQTGKPVHP